MNKLEAHNRYLGMTSVIANLENKLIAAKEKFPDKDLKEQEGILAILKDYHISHMEFEEANRIVDKKFVEVSNKYNSILSKHRELQKEFEAIKKENEELKQNIA